MIALDLFGGGQDPTDARELERLLVAILDQHLTPESAAEYRRLYPVWLEARA